MVLDDISKSIKRDWQNEKITLNQAINSLIILGWRRDDIYPWMTKVEEER